MLRSKRLSGDDIERFARVHIDDVQWAEPCAVTEPAGRVPAPDLHPGSGRTRGYSSRSPEARAHPDGGTTCPVVS